MTCDIFGTGQTNILAVFCIWKNTYKLAHCSTSQVTEMNTIDQITAKVSSMSHTHTPLKSLMNDSHATCEIDRCSVSEAVNANICKESCRNKFKSLNKGVTEE